MSSGLHLAQWATLLHGWSGLAVAYAAVQTPMLAGMMQARAPIRQMLLSPFLAAPATALVGVGMAGAAPWLQAWGLANEGLGFFALGVTLSAGLGYATGAHVARAARAFRVYQRGTIVADAQKPARSSAARRALGVGLGRDSQRRRRGVTLAGHAVAALDETKHFKIVGTTGTGKSTAIRELLRGALARGDRAIIADPDGGYLERFYDPARGDVILNPFDARSRKWHVFGEIDHPYDIDQLARSLIPDQSGPERSWRAYARTFLSAVTRQARCAGCEDVAELYRLLVSAETGELRTLLRGTPAQPFLEEQNGRMFDSIRSVTSSAVGALEYVADQQAPPFSVRKWVAHGHDGAQVSRGVLFIPYRAGQIAALRSTISAWLRLAIFEAMNRGEGDQRLWFVADELDALGQIDGLKDALARLRKFGGRCVLGFQSIAQVSSTYGMGEAQSIVENCGNTLILRCSGSEHGGTSSFASRLIGQREVLRVTTSSSRRATDWSAATTRSEHFSLEPAVLDSEVEQLPDLAGFLKFASTPHWLRVRLAPERMRARVRAAGTAPAVRPAAAIMAQVRHQAQLAWEATRRMHAPAAAGKDGSSTEHGRRTADAERSAMPLRAAGHER